MIGLGSDKKNKIFSFIFSIFCRCMQSFSKMCQKIQDSRCFYVKSQFLSVTHLFCLCFSQTVLAPRKLNGSSFCKEVVDRNLSRSVKVWMLSRKTALPLAFSLSKPHFAPFHISTLATLHINKAGFSKATYLAEHYFMFTKKDLFGCETVMSI